jgi:sodium-dependent dicarboxylate transporter 2/3/5
VAACLLGIRDPVLARAATLGGAAIILWLSGAVPTYATTFGLIAGIPLLLGPAHPEFGVRRVLSWAADPVMALFFGGFVLGIAASRYGIDKFMAERALALSRHRRRRLLAFAMAATAMLSMWMSNVAAAAMMLAVLSPHLHRGEGAESFRRALLLGVAMAANLGGMATPIGTGPNAIAIAQLDPWTRITFVGWMAFALPLMIGMVGLGYLLIAWFYRVEGHYQPSDIRPERLAGRGKGVVVVFLVAVTAWLTEPLHGLPAPVISIGTAAVLFGGGWLGRDDLGRIDWPTLFLIAGGLVMGQLVERSGLVTAATAGVRWEGIPASVRVTAFVAVAAVMGAVMSNTASAAMLIPLALNLGPPHSVAILIAIGTAFGVTFVISTPPNAMAYGHGGLSGRDFLRIGVPILVAGCLLVGLTGPAVLRWLGFP